MQYNKQPGKKREHQVITTLSDNGYDLRQPTWQEDYNWDVDVWVEGVPISIKAPTKKSVEYFRRVSLEFRKMYPNGQWANSWWYNGMAQGYLYLLGTELWYADKQHFKDVLDTEGGEYDFIRWRTLSPHTVAKQKARGHPHHNSYTANVSIDRLKEKGVLKYCGKIGGTVCLPTNMKEQPTQRGT